MEAYVRLEKLFTRLYYFDHLQCLASWDMNTYMPPASDVARGNALSVLEEFQHEQITSPDVKKWIDIAHTEKDKLSNLQRANLREMMRKWNTVNMVPLDLVVQKTLLTTKAHNIWIKSRKENNFSLFLPILKELVALARKEGAYLSAGSALSPYEALINLYEPGMTIARLDNIYGQIKSWLPQLLRDVVKKQESTMASIVPLQPPFEQVKQESLNKDLMRLWEFNFDAGRLDVSAHPFCGMTKEDCRITTRYNEKDPFDSLYSVIHETGHAKYEQNMGPREHITQPVCTSRSMGVHESQSLFAEFQIGRSAPFIQFLMPKLAEHFGQQPAFTAENMTKMLRVVKPGYIRVDADEVCYQLHVILRYEIERDLIEEKMEVEDVPRVWNEKMKNYIGLETLGRDDLGCLQDVHWSCCSFGYFPTYTLGALLAAQLMANIKGELGEKNVLKCLRNGDLSSIFALQKKKFWDHGCFYETDELITKATGEKYNPEYLRKHLMSRYLDGDF